MRLLPIWQAVPRQVSLYLVSQQHVPDLNQILLGEDKAHVSFNVGQKPVNERHLFRYCDNVVGQISAPFSCLSETLRPW